MRARHRERALRQQITKFLAKTRATPLGRVEKYKEEVILGTPSGPHTPIALPWIYTENDSPRCMIFGFYKGRNGQGNDLICKALQDVNHFKAKVGASLQLNADRNLDDDGEYVRVSHHGVVTRGQTISRDLLAELIQSAAPEQARRLGTVFAPDSWPFEIGSTRKISQLLDRLYLYVSCVQDAKDAFSALLERSLDEKPRGTGQGYQADPVVRRAVEHHAMAVAEKHYRRRGYDIDDVHKTPGMLDLKCQKDGAEIRVEVKGTVNDGRTVELTAGEHDLARKRDLEVHLAVVSQIRVNYKDDGSPTASGGVLYVYTAFNPRQHDITPTRYRCELDANRGYRADLEDT